MLRLCHPLLREGVDCFAGCVVAGSALVVVDWGRRKLLSIRIEMIAQKREGTQLKLVEFLPFWVGVVKVE